MLIGDRQLFYLLSQLDPDFQSFFKVPADISETMARNEQSIAGFARMLAHLVHDEELRPFSAAAVAVAVEQSSRMADDQDKLATHIRDLVDLLHEADHYASEDGSDAVDAAHVQQAIALGRRRRGRVRELVLESELRGQVRLRTQGEQIGQLNGMSVVMLGRAPFGRPIRITARVQLGSRGVIDIEREVALGGPIHSKGMLILSGFIGARYAPELPVSFTGSVVFEQSYGGVEGDSASLAETLALLSALGELPLKQSLAVTGAVDQHGQVEAVGGLNDKIAGFFALCQARGLTGSQGVIIPRANVVNLVLDEDIVAAATAGTFSVWAVETVDQALSLMTGLPAGARGVRGRYPKGSANRRVEDRIITLAKQARSWAQPPKEAD